MPLRLKGGKKSFTAAAEGRLFTLCCLRKHPFSLYAMMGGGLKNIPILQNNSNNRLCMKGGGVQDAKSHADILNGLPLIHLLPSVKN